MPTPEAENTLPLPLPLSLSVAPKIIMSISETELALEETDTFKATDDDGDDVSIMTQDQCLDNGHQQAISNDSRRGHPSSSSSSSNDKVSDDLNISKNTIVTNGVKTKTVQEKEFNVDLDVNRENSTDSVIAIVQNQNHIVDTDSPLTGEVSSSTRKAPTDSFQNSINNIDAIKSEYSNSSIGTNMTVIKHQNSGENIREIIANSEESNKNQTNDPQLVHRTESEKNLNPYVSQNVNSKSTAAVSAVRRRSRKLTRSENVNGYEDDKIEDPIERLNKLRASISSALSEVKGVLKQYSTEPSVDEQNESAPSSKQADDDGPVRFRFVRKIRRRSVFSEDDETEIPNLTPGVITSPIIENKVIEEFPSDQQQIQKVLTEKAADENQAQFDHKKDNEIHPVATENQTSQETKDLDETKKTAKVDEADIETSLSDVSETTKAKKGKTKKVLKKDRRASIAAVEINQISNDQSVIPVELKAQRRPSDSGTLVKQTTRIKANTNQKSKLSSSRKAKTASSTTSKTNSSFVNSEVVEKAKITSCANENQSSSSSKADSINSIVIIENQTQPEEQAIADETLQKTNSISPAIAESKTIDDFNELSLDLPILTQAIAPTLTEADISIQESIEEKDSVLVSSTSKADLPGSPSEADRSQETDPAPIVESSLIAHLPQAPHDIIEVNKIETETPVQPIKTPEEDIPQDISRLETASTPVVESTLITDLPEVSATIQPAESDNTEVIADNFHDNTKMPITPANSTKNQQALHPYPQANLKSVKIHTPIQQKSNQNITIAIPLKLCIKPPLSGKTPDSKTESSKKIQSNKSAKTKTEATGKTDTSPKTASAKVSKTVPTAPKKASSNELVKTPPKESSTQIDNKSAIETEEPLPLNVPKDAIAVKFNLPGQESVEELHKLEEQQTNKETSPSETSEAATQPETAAIPKKKRKAKRKVIIRRIKRKLSKDDTFLNTQEGAAELEICEKEIEEDDDVPEEEISDVPKQPKSCLKLRQFEIGDVVMYAEHYKKTQVRWKKATVVERITSISYKLNIDGDERAAHVSYIKKFTDRKVNFGGKEYLEIDYEKIEEDEEKERNYSIWNLV